MYVRPLAPQARRLHVVELALAEHGRAHGPRDDRREDQPDHEDDDPGDPTARRRSRSGSR